MAATNQERVGKALELLKTGLGPFVERELASVYRDHAGAETLRLLGEDRLLANRPVADWDVSALLRVMWEAWNDVFRRTLGPAERGLVGELRGHRNQWAHQAPFSSDDAYRALDSAARLLTAVSAAEAEGVEKMKMELLRLRFDEQVRSEKRKSVGTAIESQATGSLPPWREAVTPHKDVASGRYQQAEFAADLWQVHLGEGMDSFAYADSFDEAAGRYRGLRAGQLVPLSEDNLTGLLVRPEVARRQLEAESVPSPTAAEGESRPSVPGDSGGFIPDPSRLPAPPPAPKRFHGSVPLDPTRVGRDASRIADEVIAHLAGLVGATVKVTLEIEAEIPSGAPEKVVRTVTENGRTLKFTNQGFEVE